MKIAKKGKNINTAVLKELIKKCDVKIAKQLHGIEFIFFFSNGIFEVYEQLLKDISLITEQDIFDILVKGKIHNFPIPYISPNTHSYAEPNRGALQLPNGYYISIINGEHVYTDEKHPFEIALFNKENNWIKPSVMKKICEGNSSINPGDYGYMFNSIEEEDEQFENGGAVIGYTTANNIIQLALELGNL